MPTVSIADFLGWPDHDRDEAVPDATRLDSQDLPVEINASADCGIDGAAPTLSEIWRHSGWKNARSRVWRAMRATRQSVSRMAAFACCGDSAWIMQDADDPTRYRLAAATCHDRFCIPCARDRSRLIQHNICERLDGKFARFVTLTLKGGEVDLDFGIRRLLACFRRMRQRRFWKRKVDGGAAFIEFTWSPKTLAWHVHLHIICHGRFIPKADLSAEWYSVTGDSFIVDLSAVRDNAKIAQYVSKYVTKPFDHNDTRVADRIEEILTATRGKRLILTFGDWQDMTLICKPGDGEWIIVGDLDSVIAWAIGGDNSAKEALRQIFGDATHSITSAAWERSGRSPPDVQPRDEQLTFGWPSIDSRF